MGSQDNGKKRERKEERRERKEKEKRKKQKKKKSKVFKWVDIEQVRKIRRQVFLYKAYYAKH